VRFFGLAFLGRPRTPRAAGATEHAGPARAAMLGLAVLTLGFGLLPGPLLELGTDAVRLVSGNATAAHGQLTGIGTGAGDAATRYLPLLVLVLLALLVAGLAIGLRRRSPAGVVRAPAWGCGFIAPPPHLPFGDPAAQPSAAGLAQPLARMLGGAVLAAEERVSMPEPGEVAPARLDSSFRDPAFPWLLAPLARLRDALVLRAEKLRALDIRQCLMLSFGLLVLLLALVAMLERP